MILWFLFSEAPSPWGAVNSECGIIGGPSWLCYKLDKGYESEAGPCAGSAHKKSLEKRTGNETPWHCLGGSSGWWREPGCLITEAWVWILPLPLCPWGLPDKQLPLPTSISSSVKSQGEDMHLRQLLGKTKWSYTEHLFPRDSQEMLWIFVLLFPQRNYWSEFGDWLNSRSHTCCLKMIRKIRSFGVLMCWIWATGKLKCLVERWWHGTETQIQFDRHA